MDNLYDVYVKESLLLVKKSYRWGKQHKTFIYNVLLTLTILLLIGVTAYTAFNASNYYSTSSDAIVDTYLFGHGFKLHQVILPIEHSNILKIPLFYIQGHLPYHYTSFMLVNMGLVMLTIGLWTFLLIKLFGRKYEIPIIILMSVLMLTSFIFDIYIVETTIRNIEYPIALWFIFIINRLLKNHKNSLRQITLTIISSLLFSLVLAGDNLFYYAILLPILLVIIWCWVQSKKFNVGMVRAAGLVIATIVVAKAIKFIASASGLVIFSNLGLSNHTATILHYNAFFPSIGIAIQQLLQVQGSNIFGKAISLHSIYLFFNLIILIIGAIGLLLIIIKSSVKYRRQKTINDSNDFILTVLAVSFFIIFFVYIISGQVATVNNGVVTDLGQSRYLTIMPLISIVGFIWILRTYYANHKQLLYTFLVLLLIGLVFALKPINSQYSADTQQSNQFRASLADISTILEQNHVKDALTGYWYGASLRFWSHDKIGFSPIANCNTPYAINARNDWFTSNSNIKTALVIDHTGPDAPFWVCTNSQLINIYGQPIKKFLAIGSKPNTYVHIWIYNYDVREHLLPYNTVNKTI